MTELWICADCGAEVDFDSRREHLRDEHGVEHALPDAVCDCHDDEPCKRARMLTAERG